MDFTFRVVKTLEDFRQIEPAWRELEAADPCCPIMGTFDWLTLWWKTFSSAQSDALGGKKELLILCAFSDDKLAAAAPFMKVRRRRGGLPITCIEFVGQQWGGAYQDVLKRPEVLTGIDLFLPQLRRFTRYDVLFLKHIPARSDRFYPSTLIPYSACPELSVENYESFEDFKKSCSKNLRENLRQGLSRIRKEGMTVEVQNQSVDESTVAVMKAISYSKLQDNKGWLWGDPLKERFYRDLLSAHDSYATVIRLNDKPVVYFTSILYRSTAYCIDAAYDRSFPRFHLGTLSVHFSIKAAFDLGLRLVCMGPGTDEYKTRQADHLEYLCAHVGRGNTALSHVITWLVKKASNSRSAEFVKNLQPASLDSETHQKLRVSGQAV